MSAYAIMIRDKMRDPDLFKAYSKAASQTGKNHPLKPLAFYGAFETLEGAEADGVALIEFPDMAAAKAWYDSPEYQEARANRLVGADYRVIFVEGL